MVLGGETADQWEKRNRGLMEPEVMWFGRGNRGPVEKRDRGLREVKPRRKWGSPLQTTQKNEINHVYCYTLFLQ